MAIIETEIPVEDEVKVEPKTEVDTSEVEKAMTKPFTLADALREAERRGIKQVTGTYIAGENEACALGACFIVAKDLGYIE